MSEKRKAWHHGAEPGEWEYVDDRGDVAATVWRTTYRWAWEAWPTIHEKDRKVGTAERFVEAKAEALKALEV